MCVCVCVRVLLNLIMPPKEGWFSWRGLSIPHPGKTAAPSSHEPLPSYWKYVRPFRPCFVKEPLLNVCPTIIFHTCLCLVWALWWCWPTCLGLVSGNGCLRAFSGDLWCSFETRRLMDQSCSEVIKKLGLVESIDSFRTSWFAHTMRLFVQLAGPAPRPVLNKRTAHSLPQCLMCQHLESSYC